MKAYLEIITDEIRPPKEGEYIEDSLGVTLANEGHTKPYPIVIHHEIKIPDGATVLHCWPGNILSAKIYRFPIPGAKKKVKKTVYLHVQNFNGKTVYSVHDGPTAPAEAYPVEIEVEE